MAIELFDNLVNMTKKNKAKTEEHIVISDVAKAALEARVWMLKQKYGEALSPKDIEAYIAQEDVVVKAEIEQQEDRIKRKYGWPTLSDAHRDFYEREVLVPFRREEINKVNRIALEAKDKHDRKVRDDAYIALDHPEYLLYRDNVRVDLKSHMHDPLRTILLAHRDALAAKNHDAMRPGTVRNNLLIMEDGVYHNYTIIYAP